MNAPIFTQTFINPFVLPIAPTLADVLQALPAGKLSPTARRDCASAIRRLCELAQMSPEGTSASPAALADLFETAKPSLARLSAKTQANIRWAVLKACEASGLCFVMRTVRMPLLPEWEDFFRSHRCRRTRDGLSRAARFWSANEITPGQVDSPALQAFSDALLASQHKAKAPMIVRMTATLWNRVADAEPHYELNTLELECRRRRSQRVDLTDLPMSFQADLEAHLLWASGKDLFAANARARPLAPRSLRLREQQIRTSVTALIHSGTRPEVIASLAALTTPQAFRTVLEQRHEWADETANASVHGLAKALVGIASEWVKVDVATLTELKRLRSRLPKLPSGLTEKNKALLRHFDDPEALPRLYRLPMTILSKISSRPANAITLALWQAALAILIELHAPLRAGNLVMLEIGKTLFLPTRDDGETRLELPGHLVKNRQPYSVLLPPSLTRLLRQFERDFLQPLGTKLVFANGRGAVKGSTTISYLVERAIWRHMGFKMTIQQFRHLSAKVILDADPGAYPLVSQLLGHSSLKTAMLFYAELNTQRAARYHARLIEAVIERAAARPVSCRPSGRAPSPALSDRKGTPSRKGRR